MKDDSNSLFIVPYSCDLAPHFKKINEEWIVDMFALEAKDEWVLDQPEEAIINPGGEILFVATKKLGIVGSGALLKTGENEYELTKMGVLKVARGLQAGGFLLTALIDKAKSIGAKKLYLLTNKKCEAAIHLYEKHGFVHDKEIMQKFGSQYARCDVAMDYKI